MSRSRGRRRRAGRSHRPAGHPPIRSFSDALAALLGLERRFGQMHAVMLLDTDGRVIDAVALTAPRSLDEAVSLGTTLAGGHDRVRRALLLSGGAASVEQIVEAEIERWRRFRDLFSDVGVELVDWLASDGDNIRSYAITDEGEVAWSPAG